MDSNFITIPIDTPLHLKPWLTYSFSLTEKLRKETGEAILQVLNQHWLKPNWWDKFRLGLQSAKVMHREILMLSQEIPCWYGRTIIPEESYLAHPAFFEQLAREPLGALVFKDKAVCRNKLIIYPIDQQCIEYYWLLENWHQKNTQLWSRLSEFTFLDASSFYLVEILLPGLLRVTN